MYNAGYTDGTKIISRTCEVESRTVADVSQKWHNVLSITCNLSLKYNPLQMFVWFTARPVEWHGRGVRERGVGETGKLFH